MYNFHLFLCLVVQGIRETNPADSQIELDAYLVLLSVGHTAHTTIVVSPHVTEWMHIAH
jgi:hypothetical protein